MTRAFLVDYDASVETFFHFVTPRMYVAHRVAVIAAWPVRSVSSETSVASSARDKARRDETRFFFSNEAFFFITSRDACVPSFFPVFSRASEKTPHCPRVMEIHAFRLTPGQDLKKSLLSYAKGAKLEAACVVTCVGSLSKVSLRLANADGGKRGSNETVSLEERFEIVSLAGTVSRHGCHLHMSLSDYQGNVVGGHVLDGCVVFTTAEMVLGECVGHVFTRERDDETGFDELVVTTKLAVAPPPRRRNGSGESEASVASGTYAASGSAERRSDRDAPPTGETGEDARSDDAKTVDAKQKKRGFFGWLGSVVAPDPPANYATDTG